MYEVFTRLLNMSLTAGALVLVVIMLRLLLKKAPRKYICILWALVALRLICPISISSQLSLFNLVSAGQSNRVEYFRYSGHSEKPEILFDLPGLVNDNISSDSMTIGTKTSDLYLPILMYSWLAGVIAMLAYALVSFLQLKKQIAASICRESNIYICDEISSPFILGIIKARIYLSSGLEPAIETNVIAHERAHLKRRDHWWKPLGFVLLSVYWFQPMLWIAYVLLCRDIEAACDEKVVSGMDRKEITEYSQALLSCAMQRKMITACPVAFGETDVKARVKNVLNYKKPAFWIICLAIVCCVVAAVCLLTDPKAEEVADTAPVETQVPVMTPEPQEEPAKPQEPERIYVEDNGAIVLDGIWYYDNGFQIPLEILSCVITDDDLHPCELDLGDGRTGTAWMIGAPGSMIRVQIDGGDMWQEYITGENADEDALQEQQEGFSGDVSELFDYVSGDYRFLSGAGAWQTRLYMNADGTFYGAYEDTDAGSIEKCNFSGTLGEPVKRSRNIYECKVLELCYDEAGETMTEEGIQYTVSTPYGLENASTLQFILPGTRVSELSEDEYAWLSAERSEYWDRSYAAAKNDILHCCVIRSEEDYIFAAMP